MNDRELLELAAKAATYEYECTSHTGYPKDDQHQIRAESGSLMEWNPLTDNGDALRLAVKLSLLFGISEDYEMVRDLYREELTNDLRPSEATRRAIVRAAAEIGKAKEK